MRMDDVGLQCFKEPRQLPPLSPRTAAEIRQHMHGAPRCENVVRRLSHIMQRHEMKFEAVLVVAARKFDEQPLHPSGTQSQADMTDPTSRLAVRTEVGMGRAR